MPRGTDFSTLPVGTKTQSGTIQICPHCGRKGLQEPVNGKDFFTHAEVVEFDDKGGFTTKWDMCPKLSPQPLAKGR